MTRMQYFASEVLPPIVFNYLKKLFKKRWISGDYKDWTEASKCSSGYEIDLILSEVLDSTLRAIREGGYERDGVYFSSGEYSWPALFGVFLGAVQSPGRVGVLDFGGALGGLYLQNKKILDLIPSLNWNIVEQHHYIRAANENIKLNNLNFYYSVAECLLFSRPNVVLLSSVLQYLENFELIFDEISYPEAKFLIIDRTPFCSGQGHNIKVQYVPKSIYDASYPIRVFSKEALLSKLAGTWELLASGMSPEGVVIADDGDHISFEWLILRRTSV